MEWAVVHPETGLAIDADRFAGCEQNGLALAAWGDFREAVWHKPFWDRLRDSVHAAYAQPFQLAANALACGSHAACDGTTKAESLAGGWLLARGATCVCIFGVKGTAYKPVLPWCGIARIATASIQPFSR